MEVSQIATVSYEACYDSINAGNPPWKYLGKEKAY